MGRLIPAMTSMRNASKAMIVTGIMIKQPLVGMLGFIVILGGALLALSPLDIWYAREARLTLSVAERQKLERGAT